MEIWYRLIYEFKLHILFCRICCVTVAGLAGQSSNVHKVIADECSIKLKLVHMSIDWVALFIDFVIMVANTVISRFTYFQSLICIFHLIYINYSTINFDGIINYLFSGNKDKTVINWS